MPIPCASIMKKQNLATLITNTIKETVTNAETVTQYREPLVAFADADNPRFAELRQVAEATHMLPEDLVPGARSVVSFFLPFAEDVVNANAVSRTMVAREWAVAYVETNVLIGQITQKLVETLGKLNIRASAEPATNNFDPVTLISQWSHKSVAVIAGLGSFGLHHMVITDAGCAGRFGSLVLDAELPPSQLPEKERCLYFHDGSCRECVDRCPVGALSIEGGIDKQLCWKRCLGIAKLYKDVGLAEVCGKCAIGPCSFKSAV